MRYKRFTFSVLLLLCLGLTGLLAQESITAAGGKASGSGGSVSWSAGQVVYKSYDETSGSVMEGIQHPYEIFSVTGIEEANGINLRGSAYPNPTAHDLILSIDGFDLYDLTYQMYDMQGALLRNGEITGSQTSIFMGNLLPAVYYVKVIRGNKEVKTFKIIKK